MAQVATTLTPADITAVATWLASQPVAAAARPPADTLARPLPIACGSVPPDGAAALTCGRARPRALAARSLLRRARALVAWLNVRGEDALAARRRRLRRDAGAGRARRLPGARRQLRGLPHRPRRRGVRRRQGHRDAVRHGLREQPHARREAPASAPGRAAQFWRALHNGRSRDGRLLYPAFPYPNFTGVTRADADALFAYLRTRCRSRRPNRPHALRFPYDQQAALAVWRALFFSPGRLRAGGRALGAMEPRRLPGASAGPLQRLPLAAQRLRRDRDSLELSGGLIPMQNWYAPSLASQRRGRRRRLADGRRGRAAQDRRSRRAARRWGRWPRWCSAARST